MPRVCFSTPGIVSTSGIVAWLALSATASSSRAAQPQWTQDGRIVPSFPRGTEDSEISVGESKDGKVSVYSDTEMNGWRNALEEKIEAETHSVCFHTIATDHGGHLRVVDPAGPAMGALGAPQEEPASPERIPA